MAREEVIQYLEWLSDIDFTKEYPKYPMVTKKEQVEALQMAITALQELDKNPTEPNNQEVKNLNDCISRQAAIDAINALHDLPNAWLDCAVDAVMVLPTEQPEDCDTCKHGYFGDEQCNNCRVRFTSHYERRTDGVQNE